MPVKKTPLITIRKLFGLARVQVAMALGVAEDTVKDWELGRTHPRTKNEIALRDFYKELARCEGYTPPQIASLVMDYLTFGPKASSSYNSKDDKELNKWRNRRGRKKSSPPR